jgi:hypothetical protein
VVADRDIRPERPFGNMDELGQGRVDH